MTEIRRRRLKPFQLTVTGLASGMAVHGGVRGQPTGSSGGGGGGLGPPNPPVPPIYPSQVATPTFSPAGGSAVVAGATITLADATPGATIWRTTDGSTPTRASPSSATPVTAPLEGFTVKALGTAPGYLDSAVGSATYYVRANYLVVEYTVEGDTRNMFAFSTPATPITDGWVVSSAPYTQFFGISTTLQTASLTVTGQRYTGGVTGISVASTGYAQAQTVGGINYIRVVLDVGTLLTLAQAYDAGITAFNFTTLSSMDSLSTATRMTQSLRMSASSTGADSFATQCGPTVFTTGIINTLIYRYGGVCQPAFGLISACPT